jgi:CopA family copper-resistance protein
MGVPAKKENRQFISRRKFVTSALAAGAVFGVSPSVLTAQSAAEAGPVTLSGNRFDLDITYKPVNFSGQERIATVINGSLPAPTLRWREGEEVVLRVTNNLAEDSSVHWHGIILPSNMDGVPGLSFDGIRPGQSFEYSFTVNQSGTYWYHSHSGFQEQLGLYGAIIIDPRETEQISYDRDYVVMLSDWSDSSPAAIYSKLRKMGHYYNFNQRTLSDVFQEVQEKGVEQTWNDRRMWNLMRMSDRDIADVTAYTYTYLMNGFSPDPGWTALFNRGEKIRLRFINSAAMTIFDVRIPGLKMMVVAADGQNIEPVTVDEFRIGVAETYDVIVEPEDDRAYALFAQSIDRSGYAFGTLTPDIALQADVPAMDTRPVLTMSDMGMVMSGMNMPAMEMDAMPMQIAGMAGHGSNQPVEHAATEYSPQVDMRSENPQSGLNDPGIGLREHQTRYNRKVLTYADIKNLTPTIDRREPNREIQLHLTGNMHRYMWSMNGIPFADADALELTYGERLRITLVNDTMMTHPIHLHGMWSELETGAPDYIPRKHTVLVQPGKKISYLVTADALGRWAYHCHLLYHMSGMFREVKVS